MTLFATIGTVALGAVGTAAGAVGSAAGALGSLAGAAGATGAAGALGSAASTLGTIGSIGTGAGGSIAGTLAGTAGTLAGTSGSLAGGIGSMLGAGAASGAPAAAAPAATAPVAASTPAVAAPSTVSSLAAPVALSTVQQGIQAKQNADVTTAQNKGYRQLSAQQAGESAKALEDVRNTLGGGLMLAEGGGVNLQSGQFVIPADIVSDLGNGDTKAGMEFLKQFFETGGHA